MADRTPRYTKTARGTRPRKRGTKPRRNPTKAKSGGPAHLNTKQIRFVAEYVQSENCGQAAMAAGYSPRTAKSIGARLLTVGKIQEAIARRREQIATRLEVKGTVTREKLVKMLIEIAGVNMKDLAAWNGGAINFKNSETLPDELGRVIGSIGASKHGLTVRLADKMRAIELVARMMGYLVDKHEIGGPGGVAPVQLYLPDNGRNPRPPGKDREDAGGGENGGAA